MPFLPLRGEFLTGFQDNNRLNWPSLAFICGFQTSFVPAPAGKPSTLSGGQASSLVHRISGLSDFLCVLRGPFDRAQGMLRGKSKTVLVRVNSWPREKRQHRRLPRPSGLAMTVLIGVNPPYVRRTSPCRTTFRVLRAPRGETFEESA